MATTESSGTWSPAEEEIMQATYRALLTNGYGDLSISCIAAEYDKSKAALYYHYESKDEILVAFLAYVIDQFEASIRTDIGDDPTADLEHVVEKLLPVRLDDDAFQLQSVLVGLRSEAVTNDAFREQFTRIDDHITATIREIVDRGVAQGVFRPVDATQVAEYVLATVNGTMYSRVSTNRETAPHAVRSALTAYLDVVLAPDD